MMVKATRPLRASINSSNPSKCIIHENNRTFGNTGYASMQRCYKARTMGAREGQTNPFF
jgi:hypothetical protein